VALAGVRVLAVRTAYYLQHLAQKDQGKDVLLNEAWFRRSYSAGWPASMAGGGDGAALVEEAATGVPLAPGLRGSTRGGAVKVPWGVREDGNTPAQ
jgi:hypothetical protein